MATTSHLIDRSEYGLEPKTATRKLKRRGRKGNNIVTAFDNVPAIPVNFKEYAAKYNVSTNVLRQIKRHDSFNSRGQVFIRKNRRTQTVMIWRDPPVISK